MNQIKLHKKIDIFINSGVESADFDILKNELLITADSKQYFFSKIDHAWVKKLWDGDFLNAVKSKKKDETKYGYTTPEINYLVRVAEGDPQEVVNIILSPDTATTKNNFNPEVVDQFLRICGNLPTEQIKQVIDKKDISEWIRLVSKFGHFGFEFAQMFEKLITDKEYVHIVKLAGIVLCVKSKDEITKNEFGMSNDSPFYLNDLSHTKVFESLLVVDLDHAESALRITTETLSKIVELAGESDDNEVFDYKDSFSLFDVDFFELKYGEKKRISSRDDVRELASVIKEFADRIMGDDLTQIDFSRKVYETHFQNMLESPSVFRLKLYVLSIYPNYFVEELESAFDRFKVEEGQSYVDVIGGAEYERALEKSFSRLSDEYKKDYVEEIIKFFKEKDQKSKESEKNQNWHLRYGSDILSSIYSYLEENDLVERIESEGFVLNPEHKPEPRISGGDFGYVNAKSSVTLGELSKLDVKNIVIRLKEDLSPKELLKLNKGADRHNPINAEGVSKIIQEDIKNRTQEYLDVSDLFFDIDNLDSHYTYSLFRGLEDVLKNQKQELDNYNFDNLFDLFDKFINSNDPRLLDSKKKEREMYDSWLSNWVGVNSAIADVLHSIMDGDTKLDFNKYRDRLFNTVSYLLKYPDPSEEDEQPKTATSTESDPVKDTMLVSDPFQMAINTVRGRAFQAFVMFIYKDGKKLNGDVKELYLEVLKNEKTRAIMFMFGHYLSSFYYRDEDFIKKNLNSIFPLETSPSLYLSAWEGFLSTNVFKEIFEEEVFKDLYKKGINTSDIHEDFRKYFKNPNEGVAIHLALAYLVFGYEGELFELFWSDKTTLKQKGEFFHFVGSMFISGSNQEVDNLLNKDDQAKDRVRKLWNFVLEKFPQKEILSEVGMWISLEKDIFEPKWLADHVKKTMSLIGGGIDWEYGLTKTIIKLAESSPEDVIEITRYFFVGGIEAGNERRPYHVDGEWSTSLEYIFNNGGKEIKNKVYDLVDELIEKGGSPFWVLKDVIGEYEKE
jgi:hypothetical protein